MKVEKFKKLKSTTGRDMIAIARKIDSVLKK